MLGRPTHHELRGSCVGRASSQEQDQDSSMGAPASGKATMHLLAERHVRRLACGRVGEGRASLGWAAWAWSGRSGAGGRGRRGVQALLERHGRLTRGPGPAGPVTTGPVGPGARCRARRRPGRHSGPTRPAGALVRCAARKLSWVEADRTGHCTSGDRVASAGGGVTLAGRGPDCASCGPATDCASCLATLAGGDPSRRQIGYLLLHHYQLEASARSSCTIAPLSACGRAPADAAPRVPAGHGRRPPGGSRPRWPPSWRLQPHDADTQAAARNDHF